MYLLIDYREKSFINILQQYFDNNELVHDTLLECNINNINIKFKITNLSIGDFLFGECETQEKITLIVERKTIKDLCASITDGRFRQQKERLLESTQDPDKITYILEGNKRGLKTGISHTIIDSSILNLLYRHKYKVICTENEQDTFNNIILLYKKLQSNEFDMITKPTAPTKVLSKGEKIKENILAAQLCIIPGVSYSTAIIISKVYTTMKNLIHSYNALEELELKYNMLSVIQITEKRKLGNALSKKIYQALCG